MPKFLYFSVPTLWLAGMSLVSCSSEEIRTEPTPTNPVERTVALTFTIGENALTKGEAEPENKIERLSLVFFNSNNGSPLFLQKVEADKSAENDDLYIANVKINPTREPDLVVAFVNVDAPSFDGNNLPETTVNNILTEKDNLIMSSPRYYDANKNDIFYQTFDYSSSEPIELELERIAAKVTVKNDDAKLSNPTLTNADGNEVKLTLSLLNWGVTATNTTTHLMRQIGGYDEMVAQLSGWSDWNNPSKNALNWSISPNYSSVDVSSLHLINLKKTNNIFGNYCFTHETTRALNLSETNNSKPSLVITGQYSIGENEAKTFYRYGSFLLYEDELNGILTQKAAKALKMEGNAEEWISQNLSIVSVDGVESPYVSLQTNEEVNFESVTKEDGSKFSDTDDLNEYLQKKCGVAEMFLDGKCYFTIPIEHQKIGDVTLYGLVRNHLYNLNIKSIAGLGCGIASDEQILGDIAQREETQESYKISFQLHVRDWTSVEQDINIEKTK